MTPPSSLARRAGPAVLPLFALALLSSCGSEPETEDDDPVLTEDAGALTVAAALGSDPDLSAAQDAIEKSQLTTVLDGPASYTLLAPTNAAFAAVNDRAMPLLKPEHRPVLIAILRNHLLPGHLTPEAIDTAIDREGGPVAMTTLGRTLVYFSRSEGKLYVSLGDTRAALVDSATAVNNGVVIPIDTILAPDPRNAADQ